MEWWRFRFNLQICENVAKRNQIHLYRMQWSIFCPVLHHRLEQVLWLSSSDLTIH